MIFMNCMICVVGQVWRVDGEGKTVLSDPDDSKLYSGDCYIFHYTYPGETGEEYLIGTWFGKQSVQVIFAYSNNDNVLFF